MNRLVVVSGCSGGGKSTLLGELRRRGYATVEEPGRRIVQRELGGDGAALPWVDPLAFARRALELAIADRVNCAEEGLVFFDRGVVDAAAAIEHLSGEPALQTFGRAHRYGNCVFLAPPWPEIYEFDRERRHDLAEAMAEYERLKAAYPALGYAVIELPKVPVGARADFVLGALAARLS